MIGLGSQGSAIVLFLPEVNNKLLQATDSPVIERPAVAAQRCRLLVAMVNPVTERVTDFLIISDSHDELAGVIALLIEGQSFFRFNVDVWHQYEFQISQEGWFIRDQTMRSISSKTVRSVYVRKPFQNLERLFSFPANSTNTEKDWMYQQIRQAVIELISFEFLKGNVKLISPSIHLPESKSVQMHLAKECFPVPAWRIFWSNEPYSVPHDSVAKSISPALFADGKFLFSSKVSSGMQLRPFTPWFLQDLINAKYDLTVLFIEGELFAFILDRDKLDGVDWRRDIYTGKTQVWEPYSLSRVVESLITEYMRLIGLQFGRLDFLIDRDGIIWFLEVNPDGEWGWLDKNYQGGIFDRFLKAYGVTINEKHALGPKAH